MDPLQLDGGPTRVRWLGTAGFEITHGDHVVLIDPYVTRASLRACIFSSLRSDEEKIRRVLPRADAIVVGHTHFDHALDVPAIARLTGAKVFGSRSAHALCRSQGVPEGQIEIMERSEPVEREVGPFRLRFVPSAHSRFALGRVPFPGDIADCDDVPLRAHAYKCGAVFGLEITVGGKKIFHLGSAELVDAHVPKTDVDLLLLCVAGWTASERLPERVLSRLSPGAVLLSHWDNFFLPLEKPAKALPAMKMPLLVDRLAGHKVKIGAVPILGEVSL
jgi:L-ascorbate metabolism protein UlaG (beta-lactamase superfamily)